MKEGARRAEMRQRDHCLHVQNGATLTRGPAIPETGSFSLSSLVVIFFFFYVSEFDRSRESEQECALGDWRRLPAGRPQSGSSPRPFSGTRFLSRPRGSKRVVRAGEGEKARIGVSSTPNDGTGRHANKSSRANGSGRSRRRPKGRMWAKTGGGHSHFPSHSRLRSGAEERGKEMRDRLAPHTRAPAPELGPNRARLAFSDNFPTKRSVALASATMKRSLWSGTRPHSMLLQILDSRK